MGHVGSSRTNLPDLIRSEKGSGTEKGGKTSLFRFICGSRCLILVFTEHRNDALQFVFVLELDLNLVLSLNSFDTNRKFQDL